jgi:hypothetical protein
LTFGFRDLAGLLLLQIKMATSKPRPMIAAREKGPGPGRYLLPSSTGALFTSSPVQPIGPSLCGNVFSVSALVAIVSVCSKHPPTYVSGRVLQPLAFDWNNTGTSNHDGTKNKAASYSFGTAVR